MFRNQSTVGTLHRWTAHLLIAGLLALGPMSQAATVTSGEEVAPGQQAGGGGGPFRLMEATIDDIHRALRSKEVTCGSLVRAYIDRIRAYNGVCTKLVTKDGARVTSASGVVRAGSPLIFPTESVPISEVLPNFDRYQGPPVEFGRMEATASDPTVQQQFGMVVGIPDAGRVNALSTINIRGERSVTCKGGCDAHPSSGPLSAGCPAVCEAFRRQPDALERAAELDARYGSNPDLKSQPMYCVPFSIKDSFDTRDMRTTAGADVNYAMDAAPSDSTVVSELREKGAIILAKASLDEYNSGGGGSDGPETLESRFFGEGSHSTWAGTACNAYDTTRVPGTSSSGSGASVAANLAVCSICEDTGGSCRNPAAYNALVGLLTTKALIPYGGAIGSDPYLDRAGINCRTVKDAAQVLDALKNPTRGYFDPRDVHSAVSRHLVSDAPYASYVAGDRASSGKPLAGVRIGVVREFMVKNSLNHEAISDQINNEIKAVLRDRLGAELVESVDPLYADDSTIPNMAYSFQQALAEILPFHMPEYLSKKTSSGTLEFAVPGHDVTTPQYMVNAAAGKAPWPDNLNIRRISEFPPTFSFSFHLAQYLLRRGDQRVNDWASLNANAKFHHGSERVGFKNGEARLDIRSDGITERMKMREVMTLVVLKVMHQNRIDLFVNPYETMPPPRLGGPASERAIGRRFGPNAGIPEIVVPAGFNRVVYEPRFVLDSGGTSYRTVAGTERALLERPLPISMAFWAGPGDEPTLLKVASIYEAATKHRRPPPAFGPLAGEP